MSTSISRFSDGVRASSAARAASVSSFDLMSFRSAAPSGEDFAALGRELATRRLDDELEVLADRAGAVSAHVIDGQSPIFWGTSAARRGEEDVDSAIATAEAVAAAETAGVDFAACQGQQLGKRDEHDGVALGNAQLRQPLARSRGDVPPRRRRRINVQIVRYRCHRGR